MRRLIAIDGNSQRLDGGSMFGNVPRALWSRWITPDDEHRIPLACRALLVDDGDRKILLETGIGAFFEPRLRDRFGVMEGEHVLLRSLAAVGLRHEDIDTVVLSHLHFDHAGGLLAAYEEGEPHRLLFPNARFVVGRGAFERARNPHYRDRASFIDGLVPRLEATGRLELIEGEAGEVQAGDAVADGLRFHFSDGHTPSMMLTEVSTADGPVVFAADLIPGRPWVHLPITMGYDRFPERLIDEKARLLTDLVERGGSLFFTHDPDVACTRVVRDERGRFGAGEVLESVLHPG